MHFLENNATLLKLVDRNKTCSFIKGTFSVLYIIHNSKSHLFFCKTNFLASEDIILFFNSYIVYQFSSDLYLKKQVEKLCQKLLHIHSISLFKTLMQNKINRDITIQHTNQECKQIIFSKIFFLYLLLSSHSILYFSKMLT